MLVLANKAWRNDSFKLKESNGGRFRQLHKYTRTKYLRKIADDMMTGRKLNIPESVTEFIQRQVPKSIGTKHYMWLKREADRNHSIYAEYLTELKRKTEIMA